MEGHQQVASLEWHAELALEHGPFDRRHAADRVDAWTTDVVNAPALFTQLSHPPRRIVARHEMSMGELGDGMAHGVVERTFGDVASGDMRYGDARWQRRAHRGERLEPVTEHQQYFWRERSKSVGESADAEAHRAADRLAGIADQLHVDSCIDGEAVGLDAVHRRAKFGRKMHSSDHQLQRKLRRVTDAAH